MARRIDDDSIWLAFLLKDRFSSNFEKERLRAGICLEMHRDESDICYVPFERNVGLSYYFFVLERDHEMDMHRIYEYRSEAFEPFDRHKRISGRELNDMMRNARQCSRGYVKQGDLVMIRSGIYSKLHGVVLREDRSGRAMVGMKFCFGTVVEGFDISELEVEGNIFNYMKVLR